MNPKRPPFAALLFPLALAACSADVRFAPTDLETNGGDEGGAGGGSEWGSGGKAEPAPPGSGGAPAGGQGGAGGTSAASGPVARFPAAPQELSGAGGNLDPTSGSGTSSSSTASSSTAGSGGAGPDLTDTCPGESYALVLDAAPIVIDGTTVGGTDSLDTCFTEPEGDGPERVYAFDLSGAGNVHFDVTHGVDLDAGLVIRTTCDSDVDEYCYDVGNGQESHHIYRTDTKLFVIVDSEGATSGAFQLVASLTTNVCGDGIVGPGEECDVGAAVANDGCGDPGDLDECTVQGVNQLGDICPGEPTPVPSGASVLLASSGLTTLGHTDDAIGSCMPEVGGADRVFQLLPAVTGTLRVRVGMTVDGSDAICSIDTGSAGCFDVEIYARSTCESADPGDELACASTCCDGEEITFPVTQGVAAYLFVDGYDQFSYSNGPFNVHFDLTPE